MEEYFYIYQPNPWNEQLSSSVEKIRQWRLQNNVDAIILEATVLADKSLTSKQWEYYTWSKLVLADCFLITGKSNESQLEVKHASDVAMENLSMDNFLTGAILYENGKTQLQKNNIDKAIEYFLSVERSLKNQDSKEAIIYTAFATYWLAVSYSRREEFETALALYEVATNLFKDCFGKENVEYALVLADYAVVQNRSEQWEAALSNFEKALPVLFSNLPEDDAAIANYTQELASIYYKKGDYAKVIEYAEVALRGFLKRYGENHQHTADLRLNLGEAYFQKGKEDKARHCLETALGYYLEKYGENHFETADCRKRLAHVYLSIGENMKAMEQVTKAVPVFGKFNYPHFVAECIEIFGRTLLETRSHHKAKTLLEQALTMYQAIYGENSLQVATCKGRIGIVLLNLGESSKAYNLMEEAKEVIEGLLGENDPLVAQLYYMPVGLAASVAGDPSGLARKLINTAYEIYRDAFGEESRRTNYALYSLGQANFFSGDFINGLIYAEKSFQMRWNTYGDRDSRTAKMANEMGDAYLRQGDYDQSISFFEKAILIYAALVEKETVVKMETSPNNKNLPPDFNTLFPGMAAAFEDSRHIECAKAILGLGDALFKKGQFRKSVVCYEAALPVIRKYIKSPNAQPVTATTDANETLSKGRSEAYSQAFENLIGKKQELLREETTTQGENIWSLAKGLRAAAIAYRHFGEHEKSQTCIQQALNLLQDREKQLSRQGDLGEIIWTRLEIAEAYLFRDEPQQALPFAKKAVDALIGISPKRHPADPFPYVMAYPFYLRGLCYLKLDDPFEAAKHFQETVVSLCTDNMFSHGSAIITSDELQNLSWEEIQKKSMYPWLAFTPVSIKNYFEPLVLLDALKAKADAFYQIGERKIYPLPDSLHAAWGACIASANIMDEMRKNFRAENSRWEFAERTKANCGQMISIAIEMGRLAFTQKDFDGWKNRAFAAAERGKSFIMYAAMKEAEAKMLAELPEALQTEEKKLRSNIFMLEKSIADAEKRFVTLNPTETGMDVEQIEKWKLDLFAFRNKWVMFISELEKSNPEYIRLKSDVKAVEVVNLQAKLAINEAVLEFFIYENTIFIFMITQELFQIFMEPKPDNYQELLESFIDEIWETGRLDKEVLSKEKKATIYYSFIESSMRVSCLLMGRVLSTNFPKEIDRLYIIPDETMAGIPFEALVQDDKRGTYSNLCKMAKSKNFLLKKISQWAVESSLPLYLNKRFCISYHYSASLLYHGWEKKKKQKETPNQKFIGFLPIFKNNEMGHAALDFSLQIIERATPFLRQGGYDVTSFLEGEATKTAFQRNVKGKKQVLVISHNIVDHATGQTKGIAFHPDGLDKQEDCFLDIHEVYNLHLDATELVVLDCCDTGVGKVVQGEGIVAMNRGFLYAGAANVIYTLFKVRIDHSKDFIPLLFEAIFERKSIDYARALQEVKRYMIDSGTLPAAWAGFVMIGD